MYSRRRRRVKWLPLLGITKESRDNIAAWCYVGLGSLLVTALVLNQLSYTISSSADAYSTDSASVSRHLLEDSHGPEWEQCDFETSTSSGAWIFCHTVGILIIFIALAIVCDDFFVPSLELISEKLQLSEDVAGATFMAAGSSAPELFTSVAGVAIETDVGVGTIVGSAVFNLLIIIALTAALAGQVLHLDWRPLARDSFFYAASLVCFIGFVWDGYFVHYEAVILLLLYIAYIILMVFNPRLMDWMGTWKPCCGSNVEPSDEEVVKDVDTEKAPEGSEERKMSLSGGHAKRLQVHHKVSSDHQMHIFQHNRGSVAGVLMLQNPPIIHHHYRENGQTHPRLCTQLSNPGRGDHFEMQSTGHRRNSGADSTSSGDTLLPAVTVSTNHFKANDDAASAANKTGGGVTSGAAASESSDNTSARNVTCEVSLTSRSTVAVDVLPPRSSASSEAAMSSGSRESLKGDTTTERIAKSSVSTSQSRLTPVEQPDNSHSIVENINSQIETRLNQAKPTKVSQHGDNPEVYHSGANSQALVITCLESNHANSTDQSQGHTLQNVDARKNSLGTSSKQMAAIEEKENGEVPSKENDKEGSEGGDEEEEEEKTIHLCPCLPCCCPVRTWPPDSTEAKEKGGSLAWFKLIIRWVLFILAFPFVALFSWTIPDCSKEHLKKWYLVSFLMSVFWIAVLSFGMVTLAGRMGCIIGIDTYIMGLVVIAIGTSIPDTLSSILVARDGYGDMAVSNAIGSNVFDINLGLGLPFIIRIAIDTGEPIALLSGEEWAHFYSGHMPIIPHAKFGFILLLILAIALIMFSLVKFRLTKYIGISFVFIYVLFLVYAFTQELYCVRKLDLYC